MNTSTNPYADHRYPTEIISHGVWLYFRFTLSFHDIEELFAARGIILTYETIRQWCLKFGHPFANEIRHRLGRHLMKATHYRLFRYRAFVLCREVTCVKNAAC